MEDETARSADELPVLLQRLEVIIESSHAELSHKCGGKVVPVLN
jgi:hypothetical protein